MKKITPLVWLTAAFVLFLYGGCGGSSSTPPTPTPNATTAVLTLSSAGTLPANTQIGGVDVTLNLPVGATVKTAPSKAAVVTYSGIVTVSGVAVGANAIAIGASPTPEQLKIEVANPSGFGVGEFATVTCDIAAGSNISAADFASPVAFSAVDLNGVPIQGLTAELVATMQ